MADPRPPDGAGDPPPRWLIAVGAVALGLLLAWIAFSLGVYMAERGLLGL